MLQSRLMNFKIFEIQRKSERAREREGGERERERKRESGREGERTSDGGMEKENAFATILVKCEHLVL